jgi:hypothetical protein
MLESTGRTARARRREAFWNNVTLAIGCGAVIAIIAAIIFVLTEHMMRPPLADAGFYEDLATKEANHTWSGEAKQEQSLFESTRGPRQPGPELKSGSSSVVKAIPVTEEKAASLSTMPAPAAPMKAVPVVAGIDRIEEKRSQITQAVAAFFSAKDVLGKLPYVRNPERVRPLMENYYQREPLNQFKWRDVGKMARLDEPGYRFGYVQALFEDATPASLLIEETAQGEYRIDWESLVRYGELSWKDFLQIHPTHPKLMRLIASRPEGSNSESTAAVVELRHPVEAGTVLGTFDRTDPKYAPLLEQLEQRAWKDVPVTLRLCYPRPPESNEKLNVQIASVEGKGWVILDQTSSTTTH